MGRADEGTAPAVFLHGGGPGCSAWTDFGPTAELFARHRQCHFVDLLQYGKSDKSPIEGPRWTYLAASLVELLDALDVDRADVVVQLVGRHDRHRPGRRPPRPCAFARRHRLDARLLRAARAAPRGRPARPQRPRSLLRRGGADPRQDARADGLARVVRRHAHPGSDRAAPLRAEPRCRRDAPRRVVGLAARRVAGSRGTPAGDPLPHAVRLGHARRLPHARLPDDARPHGSPRPAVRDGCGVAPPAGGAAVGLRRRWSRASSTSRSRRNERAPGPPWPCWPSSAWRRCSGSASSPCSRARPARGSARRWAVRADRRVGPP